MEWLKKVPIPVMVTFVLVGGVIMLGVVGGYIALSLAGLPTDDFTRFVNTLLNFVLLPISILGTSASVSVARSAGKAEEQTNGSQKEVIKEAVIEAHKETGLL